MDEQTQRSQHQAKTLMVWSQEQINHLFLILAYISLFHSFKEKEPAGMEEEEVLRWVIEGWEAGPQCPAYPTQCSCPQNNWAFVIWKD